MSTGFATFDQPKMMPVVIGKQQGKKQCVLIIDDDSMLSEVLGDRLKRQGMKTLAAFCGKDGLSQARIARPSVIILDLGLPDTDGLTVCEQLADSPETCSIPILILSGRDEPGLVRRCRAAGCHYFLHKPYDPNALLILVRQAIQETSQWQEGVEEFED